MSWSSLRSLGNLFTYNETLRESVRIQLLWSVFFRIRTEYGEILRVSPYAVRMRENMDQNNSEYGHFLRSKNVVKKQYEYNVTN